VHECKPLLGGSTDKSGEISTEKLRAVVKDFGLTIDIEKLIRETDSDGSGKVDYEEFKAGAYTRPHLSST